MAAWARALVLAASVLGVWTGGPPFIIDRTKIQAALEQARQRKSVEDLMLEMQDRLAARGPLAVVDPRRIHRSVSESTLAPLKRTKHYDKRELDTWAVELKSKELAERLWRENEHNEIVRKRNLAVESAMLHGIHAPSTLPTSVHLANMMSATVDVRPQHGDKPNHRVLGASCKQRRGATTFDVFPLLPRL